MGESRVALRDLAEPRVSLQWFEAVAVALGMAESWPAHPRKVAPFDAFTIDAEGAIRPLPQAAASAAPARELGVALQTLLVDPMAPPALRDLAHAAAQAGPDALAAPHVAALNYFERPDRARILLFLAQRVVPQLPEVDVEEELRRLEARARARAESERPPGWRARARVSLGRAWVRWRPALPALALAVLLVATAWIFYSSPAVRAAVVEPARGMAQWLRPASAPTAPAPEPAAEGAPPTHGSRPRRTPPVTASEGPAPSTSPRDPTTAVQGDVRPAGNTGGAAGQLGPLPVIRDVRTVEPSPEEPREASVEGIGRVYHEGEPGVVPARLERNPLPEESPQGASSEQTGVFELIVDEQGRVLRVRLLSRTNSFQERMLLSAAKAWRFEPAHKDGLPVKFLTQVRITW